MKPYLAGIKSYQHELGIECAAFADPRLEPMIPRIKRDHLEPERQIQTQLTQPHLLLLLRHLSRANYNDVATRAAFTLAFAAFLRVVEFSYKQRDLTLGDAFPKWFLTKGSVKVQGRGAYIELTLPSSKTDPFRKGIKLTIAASLDNPCPVCAMEEYLTRDTHRPYQAPLFCIGSLEQEAFAREYDIHKLHGVASRAGLDYGMWNAHSFRRDAATWAAQVGISETEIQTLGRWKSDPYKAYIEYSDTE